MEFRKEKTVVYLTPEELSVIKSAVNRINQENAKNIIASGGNKTNIRKMTRSVFMAKASVKEALKIINELSKKGDE